MNPKIWRIGNDWQRRRYVSGEIRYFHVGERVKQSNFHRAFSRQLKARLAIVRKVAVKPKAFDTRILRARHNLADKILSDFDTLKEKLSTKKFTDLRIVIETRNPRGRKWRVAKFKSIRKFEHFLGLDERYNQKISLPTWKKTKHGLGKLHKRIYIGLPKIRAGREMPQTKILNEYEIH